jgi:hypothetical protein
MSLCFTLGILFLPLTSALLATMLYVDKGRKITSAIVCLFLVIFDFFINSIFSLFCLESVIIAVIIYLFFSRARSKAESSVYISIAALFFIFVQLFTSVYFVNGSISISGVKEFYILELEAIKVNIIDTFIQSGALDESLSNGLSLDDVELLIDSLYRSIASALAIVSFFIAGVTLKIFTVISKRFVLKDPRAIEWKFSTSSLFVWCYLILSAISIFGFGGEDIFTTAFFNLYVLFMFVYAYVGFKRLSKIIEFKFKSKMLSIILVVIAILFIPSYAVQLLSYIGAFMELTIKRSQNDFPLNRG